MHPPTEDPASRAPAAPAPEELNEPLYPVPVTLELTATHRRELETLAQGYEVSPEQFISANVALLLDVLANRYDPSVKWRRAN